MQEPEDIHSANAATRLGITLAEFYAVFHGPESELRKKYREIREEAKTSNYKLIYEKGN